MLHTFQLCRGSTFQSSKAWLSRGCPILNHKPQWKRVFSQVSGRKSGLHDQGWFPNIYLTANTSGLERSLGMALIWPRGLGKELPTLSPVGVHPLLTAILNKHCPALNTAQYLTLLGKSCSIQTLSITPVVSGRPSSALRSLLKLFQLSPILPSSSFSPCPLLHTKPTNFPFLCYIKIICKKSTTLSSGLSSIMRAYSHVAAVLISGARLFSAGTKCSQLFPVQGRWVAYQSHAFRGCGTV